MKRGIAKPFEVKSAGILMVLVLAALAAGILIGKFVLVSPVPQGNFSGEMKMEYHHNFDDMGASAVERKGDHGDSPYFNDVDFYNAQSTDSLYILPHFQTIQQTSWWSCGVSASEMVLNYYGARGDWNEET